jgi:uncharacterized protein YqfB (UPF0267 family)
MIQITFLDKLQTSLLFRRQKISIRDQVSDSESKGTQTPKQELLQSDRLTAAAT